MIRIRSLACADSNVDLSWHLDIKPGNILYCNDGWKIADPGCSFFKYEDKVKKIDGVHVV